jgi:hypothetical protein
MGRSPQCLCKVRRLADNNALEEDGQYVHPSLVDANVLRQAQEYGHLHRRDLRQNAQQPFAPYPGQDNPMLRYLVQGALAMLDKGSAPRTVILQAVVHAWFEGHIEGREAALSASAPP